MADGDSDKSEEASAYKLSRAREKGQVARGTDLSFLAGLIAFAAFVVIAGEAMIARLAQMMREVLVSGISTAGDPRQAIGVAVSSYGAALRPVMLFGGTIIVVVGLFELVQVRGFMFSAHPLKPDFSRINPAKGLKRLFSMRLLKEALKSVIKMAVYSTVTWLLIKSAIGGAGSAVRDAPSLVAALRTSGMRMIWVFAGLAFFFAMLDQVVARGEFRKQMRMSRREVTREGKEREGDPRLKRKRKQLHAEFVERSAGLGALPGSDMLVVNPQHVAVALAYDRARASAPVVRAKARGLHALILKRRARLLGIPIFERPPLARALFADGATGAEIGAQHYHAVAELYHALADAPAKDPT